MYTYIAYIVLLCKGYVFVCEQVYCMCAVFVLYSNSAVLVGIFEWCI